jgi:glyoxylase-like metal-dependent hydrolase (beta-lactamase superfamily II)
MATVKVLYQGYLSLENHGMTAATISLVLDKDLVIVVDPGYVEDRYMLIEALAKEGFKTDDVNMVFLTHSHIDHYANIGLFKNAKFLDYFGLWDQKGRMESWHINITDDIKVLKTPGHDYSSITLFVKTGRGTVAICGDVFWKEDYPEIDSYASDLKELARSRKVVLETSHWIVPGHGAMYKTKNGHRLEQVKTGKKLSSEIKGECKKCKRAFIKSSDRCACQEWLCCQCCECGIYCNVCSCKVRREMREPLPNSNKRAP